jgi:hypothetical protein
MCTFPLVRRCDPLGIDIFTDIIGLPIDLYEVYQLANNTIAYGCVYCLVSIWCSGVAA